jgi:polyphosphate glucokinase
MASTEQLELRGGRHVTRCAVLRCHHGAVLADLLLVIHVLLREAVGLLVQEQGGNGVRREWEAAELLTQASQAILLVQHPGPLGVGQGGCGAVRHFKVEWRPRAVIEPVLRIAQLDRCMRGTQRPAQIELGRIRLRAGPHHANEVTATAANDPIIEPLVKILVIDVGGSHVKVLATNRRTPLKLPSGPKLTPQAMVAEVLEATAGWKYDAVSIGYPGPVANNQPTAEPVNLGKGWVRFDFKRAFKLPVRMVNDAAMQALGSYEGGRMLFLALGTGLGMTLVRDGVVVPLEVAHLPYHKGKSYEDFVGERGLKRLGVERWKEHVTEVVALLLPALTSDYAVLGGGNVRLFEKLPPNCRRGTNLNAFRGGYLLWKKQTHLT